MKKKDFEQLVESVREMKRIRSGNDKPARVVTMEAVDIKKIREKIHQSQADFAYMIGVSPSTLRNWEQGLREPQGPARALLKVAEKNPEAVLKALHM
ncbi:MAG TPA: NadS family protein [Candidatus Bathyarchaeia archaeon]|nr:NadS family protein [Candidatus Bathyarchaeia archaeon]